MNKSNGMGATAAVMGMTKAMSIGMTAIAADIAPRDMVGNWAEDTIARAVSLGIVAGYEDGTFRPLQPITRQELAAITARALGAEASGDLGELAVYADRHLLGEWTVRPGAYLTETGILRGRTEQRLEPLARTTRAEALTIILRLLEFRTLNN